MISFISLFFAPMISVMIYYRRGKREMSFSPLLLLRYGKFACINCAVASLAKLIVSAALKREIDVESTVFLIIAVVVAFVLPYIFELLGKCFHIECEISNE